MRLSILMVRWESHKFLLHRNERFQPFDLPSETYQWKQIPVGTLPLRFQELSQSLFEPQTPTLWGPHFSRNAGNYLYVNQAFLRWTGAIQLDVGPELLQVGTRVQLHAYGRSAAIDDMEAHVAQLVKIHRANGVQPFGQLMVTCLGRGEQLYGDEGVETATLADAWLPNEILIPTAGFFAGSEIGPVGYRSYTHSYVTSLALFRPRW